MPELPQDDPARTAHQSPARPRGPSSAGMYDYALGGKDNHAADRAAVDSIGEVLPEVRAAAWANRGFHQRAALWMAQHGITQLIDLGCGLPTTPSTQEAVQKITPAARVLYVDHDPTVAARAHALLTRPGTTSAALADLRDPRALLELVRLDGLIDLAVPAGLLCTAVLEHIPDPGDPWSCLARLVWALAPGSYLALSHLTADHMPPDGMPAVLRACREATDPVCPRPLRQITRFFGGLELIPPYRGAARELCTAGQWGAEDPELADDASSRWWWAGVARRPHGTPPAGPPA